MHWTYEPVSGDHLDQGDILKPTPGLRSVLDEVHPHFGADKYLAFVVTTQSCDLVRRRGRSSAKYIGIATVRSLASVWLKILGSVAQEPLGGSYFGEKDKPRAEALFKRIVDQNEQALGLFYLHPDGDTCIGDPSVAFLRVTVSLQADKHYDALLASRSARLRPDFRAKFGWLLGNLYARAATRDWADDPGDAPVLADVGARLLAGDVAGVPRWVDDERAKAAKKAELDFSADHATVDAALAALEYKARADRVLDRVMGKVQPFCKLNPMQAEQLRKRLLDDHDLQTLLGRVGPPAT